MAIKEDLEADIARYTKRATSNYWAAYLLSVVAVLASVAAGLSAAGTWLDKDNLALLSTLPGAILVILKTFKFEERSNWHYRTLYTAKRLHAQLTQGRSEAKIGQEWWDARMRMLGEWPGFGKQLN